MGSSGDCSASQLAPAHKPTTVANGHKGTDRGLDGLNAIQLIRNLDGMPWMIGLMHLLDFWKQRVRHVLISSLGVVKLNVGAAEICLSSMFHATLMLVCQQNSRFLVMVHSPPVPWSKRISQTCSKKKYQKKYQKTYTKQMCLKNRSQKSRPFKSVNRSAVSTITRIAPSHDKAIVSQRGKGPASRLNALNAVKLMTDTAAVTTITCLRWNPTMADHHWMKTNYIQIHSLHLQKTEKLGWSNISFSDRNYIVIWVKILHGRNLYCKWFLDTSKSCDFIAFLSSFMINVCIWKKERAIESGK